MPEIIIGQNSTPQVVVDEKMVNAHPELQKVMPVEATAQEKQVAQFHAKDITAVKNQIRVPDIFFWVDYNILQEPTQMTVAFKWLSKRHGVLDMGETWKIEKEWSKSRRRAYERKLMKKMVDTLGLLVHMGDLILDFNGDIDPTKAEDEVARRYFLDKMWKARLDAFHKVVRVKMINVVKAKELGLL